MKHKHYDVIVAFAEGKAIQYKRGGEWRDWATSLCPNFSDVEQFRIKPQKSWRWVVSPVDNPNDISITRGHFSDAEQVHMYFSAVKHFSAVKLCVHQPVLSTEKEE